MGLTDDHKIKGDPRKHFRGNHRERGPRKHVYTAEQVAKIAGLTVGTLLAYQAADKLDLRDFESTVRFLADRIAKQRKHR
jgi:hypothetical protein